jgi:hypothetical protein
MIKRITISLLLLTISSCMVSKPVEVTCVKPSKIQVEVNSKFFTGRWYNRQIYGQGTDTSFCEFYVNGSFSCHIVEHGPIDKQATIYHADEYWEKGNWSFQNGELSKTVHTKCPMKYQVVSATDNDYVISFNSREYWFTKDESCLG